MRSPLPIIWLARRQIQETIHQGEVKAQKKSSMKQQGVPFAPLRVARKLQSADRQIRDTLNFHRLTEQRRQRLLVTPHNVTVSFGNGGHGRSAVYLEHQRIIQAARPLQNCSAAATTAQYLHLRPPTRLHVHFARDFIGKSGHNKALRRFPKAQDFSARAIFASVEQRLVAREIGRGGRQI